MGNFDERDRKPAGPVVIEDLRHRRDVEDIEIEEEPDADPAPAVATAPEPVAEPISAAQASAPVTTPEAIAAAGPSAATATGAPAPAAVDFEAGQPGEPTEEELAAQEAEYAYLMQIFGLGLGGYLRSQLGILLNFALINLGRAANPATGLIGADLDQAKVAIDTLEFILSRLQAGLDPRERTEMMQMLSELKYTFMQAVSAAAPKITPPAGGAAG